MCDIVYGPNLLWKLLHKKIKKKNSISSFLDLVTCDECHYNFQQCNECDQICFCSSDHSEIRECGACGESIHRDCGVFCDDWYDFNIYCRDCSIECNKCNDRFCEEDFSIHTC